MRVTHCISHHEINIAIEQGLEILLQPEVGVEWIRHPRGELDEKVDVTRLGVEPVPGCRAEQLQASYPTLATRAR